MNRGGLGLYPLSIESLMSSTYFENFPLVKSVGKADLLADICDYFAVDDYALFILVVLRPVFDIKVLLICSGYW